MRVLFLIRALNVGGAQRQFITLANGLARRGHTVTLVVYYPRGELLNLLDVSVKFVSLDKRNRWDLLSFFYRLVRLVQEEQPEIVYSFMEEANIVNVCLKLFFPELLVFWGVRHSFVDLSKYDWATWAGETVESHLVRFVDHIIFNSYAGMDTALAKGFPASRSCVILNGVDIGCYCPDCQSRARLRQEWGVLHHERLIGIVGRLDPMKDHQTFLRAVSNLMFLNFRVRFIIIGDGPQYFKLELQRLSRQLGLENSLIWAGNRMDMPFVYNALDILVSSSAYGEGFSNTIGEAMACGIPCVVTNVGDNALIVEDNGIVVPPGNPDALAQALKKLLFRIQDVDHERIRRHIVERFSVESMIDATEKTLLHLLQFKESDNSE